MVPKSRVIIDTDPVSSSSSISSLKCSKLGKLSAIKNEQVLFIVLAGQSDGF